MAITKVKLSTRTLADNEVAIRNISGSSAASAGTFLKQDGTWASIPTSDTSGIEDDIALLGFKVATAGSMAKYNLVNQTEDAFVDQTGIDTIDKIERMLLSILVVLLLEITLAMILMGR